MRRGKQIGSTEARGRWPQEKPRGPGGPGRAVCVHELFAARAATTPDAPALVADDRWISYGELETRSNRLARHLRRLGVGPEVLVGVAIDRSPELVLAQLGVLKAGGAYLSLAPGDPPERLGFMLEDSGVTLLLTARTPAPDLAVSGIRRIDLHAEAPAIGRRSARPIAGTATPAQRAYVIYTSGSTGRPKGTELVHSGLANLVAWHRRRYDVGPGDRATQVASPAFDASVWEIWPYVTAGATLFFPLDATRVEPSALYRFLAERAVTHSFLPTPIAEAMLQEAPPAGLALEHLLVGGDRLHRPPPPGLPFRLVNHYGPTEDTVVSTAGETAPRSGEDAPQRPPSIGRPIDATRVRLLDAELRPVATGEAGELAVGGAGLARGYLRRPALTAERFVPDASGGPGERLYLTGDLVSARPGGDLDFLGRIDHQVKIRGFRIELGEIEAVLDEHPAGRASVVLARGDGGEARLVAFVVPRGERLEDDLLEVLETRLPEHMVPSALVELAELPLTPNGKVDRAALLRLELPAGDAAEEYEPPTTPTEKALAEIWRDLLGLDRVGIHDHFFALGGHSLLAGRMVSRLRRDLEVEVPLADLYTAPTIAGLAAKIAGGGSGARRSELPPIEPAPRDQPIPLSFTQERVWFLHQLAPGNIAYNSQATFRYRGPLDPGIYRRVLTEIVRRHEVFRTRFPVRDGRPVQEVQPPMPVPLPVVDLSGLDAGRREDHAEAVVQRELRRPFDIENLPLARWMLLKMEPLDHILVQVEFHYVHDGWSFALLLRETKALYEAYAAGRPSPLPEPPIQYADFAYWQRRWMRGEVLEEQLRYWSERLAGGPPVLQLPTDFPRPKVHSFKGAGPRLELDLELCRELRRAARREGVTLFVFMLAVFETLLHRTTGERDLLIGTAAANRRSRQIEQMIGMVVNTLVLRTDLGGDPSFRRLLERVQETALGAYAYQDMPLEKLVERLAPERDLSRNPLFQVMFSFHDSEVPDLEFAGLTGEVLERNNGSAKADLNVIVIPRAEQRVGQQPRSGQEGIAIIWEYSTDLFTASTMQRTFGHFTRLLRSAARSPASPISELGMLGAAERWQLVGELGDTAASYAEADRCLHRLFELQAARTPDAVAVTSDRGSLTYRRLDEAANQVAHRLRRLGVGPEVVAGVLMQRSLEMVVALYGVLKAGGAYLPLDPELPPERLAFMAAQTGSPAVLAQEGLEAPAGLGSTVVVLDGELRALEGEPRTALPTGAGADNLAYVIYTSGSTGRPKGVMNAHRGIVNRLLWMQHAHPLRPDDRLLQKTPFSFDVSVPELFWPLLTGARLVMARPGGHRDPAYLARTIAQQAITTIHFVPSMLQAFLATADLELCGSLRRVLASGEALTWELEQGCLARLGVPLHNLYGPTEAAVEVSFWSCRRPPRPRSVPIGRPIANTRLQPVDARLEPVPLGVPGELLIGGIQVARGYRSGPSLTAESFVPDPFGAAGTRVYRTGDLTRFLADGRIEFLGRRDHQIKMRGFRIELGEIEAVLREHPGVRQAAVTRVEAPLGARLVAHVVPAGEAPDAAALRAAAQRRLPEYMVPAAFAFADELPMTASGKVDRRALAGEAARAAEGALDHAAYVAPSGPVEEMAAAIFAEVLRAERVGANDHFFALGGHSLLATRVVSRLREVFAVELPVRAIFEHPTVGELARLVEAARGTAARAAAPLVPVDREQGLPLTFAQERLWFIDRLIPDRAVYHIARAWSLEGPLRVAALEGAVRAVLERHEALRTTFVADGGRPLQRVVPPPGAGAAVLPVLDLAGLSPDDRRREGERLRREEVRRTFDFESGPLARTTLVRLGEASHLLLLTQHHIVSDVWSLGVLQRELAEVYGAASNGRAPALEALPVQYGDFAVWQREQLQGEVLDEMLAFWRRHLEGAPAVLELPTDRPRPPLQTFRGARRWLAVAPELGHRLDALARAAGATPFMLLHAAWGVLLGRWSGQDDVVLGTPIAARQRRELEGLVGLFVNTLALRCRVGDDPTFRGLLARTRDTTLSAYAHQEMPFEKLVDELVPQRNLSHSPLFQVLFSLQNAVEDDLELPGLEVSPLEIKRREAHFDLTLFASQEAGGFRLLLNYNRDLFDAATIARLARQYSVLLDALSAAADRPISRLPILAAADRHHVVVEWNDTAAPAPRHRLLHQPFEERAARSPRRPAVVSPGLELSYGELDGRANRLARELVGRGVGPGALVGVYLERSPEMIVAVLAVLKAGGAYVPLETSWPAERVRWIVEANGLRHLVTDASRRPAIDELELPRLRHVVDVGAGEARSETAPPPTAGPQDLAYVIFTSGSTGRPKGVMVRHRPAVNLVHWVNRRFDVGEADRLLFITALSFDLSVYDIFGILAAGGSIRLASSSEARDPQQLIRILRHEPITFWDSAPAALQQCVPFFPPPATANSATANSATADSALRLVFLSGDWIPVSLPDRIRDAFRGAEVVSLGGATEAVVWSNFFPVGEVDPDWVSIPYGRPISNARYYVLDAALAPCPVGIAGDLYIGGGCLSVGYASQPALTARQYLPDPFAALPGKRLYRTGDRARAMTCGNLEFLGRLDTQVKIRGYRIELGEIESVLASHPRVHEAVVLARGDSDGARGSADRRLVAYLIPRSGHEVPTADELRELAGSRLPEYMVPAAFVPLESWPLSATGKLDRGALGRVALPGPERGRPAAEPAPAAAASPRQELERLISELWCEVLGLESVGLDDSFFDLGGHSLLMAQCHARLQELLSRELLMVDLFRFPTVGSLAAFLAPEAAPAEAPAAAAGGAVSVGREIAVVGLAGRFPGARDVEELWRNLRDGVESIRFFSDDELLAAGLDPAVLEDPRYVRARGALDEAEHFDAAFFGMAPREAELTDPQQRAFLECAWHALEHAGYDPQACGGRIGVFGGLSANRYLEGLLAAPGLEETVGRWQMMLGNQHDYLASRLSYKLDLKGPSLNVQTACSTSLVAVHLACASLLLGECEMALAGGVSIHAGEVKGYLYSEGGIDSPDGHTRAFDASARGVVNGSGVGMVVLKRLADAVADGDRIHAVILGSASNNDGTTGRAGFTAPSAEGQERAIRDAQARAGVAPETVSYVEAHGTATPVGDPIEVTALTRAFRSGTGERGFCALGSVKTNIGHLDAAAGIAGLIKTVLALEHRQIPPSLHFETPNPECGFESSPFYVSSTLAEWPADGTPRRAGVSSFGIGGSNAHVVLQEAPAAEPSGASRPAQLLLVSARTPAALERAAERLADHLERDDSAELADVAFTLSVGRRAFAERRIAVCRDRSAAIEALRRGGGARPADAGSPGELTPVFLFPGQGAQYAGMGGELYRREPTFREVVDECCERLEEELGLDLRELLFPPGVASEEDDFEIERTAIAQPALFVVELALARVWMGWGVRPAAMLGHSVGELVAACLAGVFELDDALRLVARRGRWMEEMPGGDMLAVGLPEDEVADLLAAVGAELSLAAVNGPAACVVSGEAGAVGVFRERVAARGAESRRLHTSHAFHSRMMEPVVERFTAEVARLDLKPPRIPFASNVTGRWITPAEATDPAYWGAHLRRTVRFADGLGEVLTAPGRLLVEAGPGRQLTTLARQHPAKASVEAAVASLPAPGHRGRDFDALLAALGKLWLAGAGIDWPAFWAGERRRRVPLPGYPFERRRVWPAELPPTIAPGFLGAVPGPAEPQIERPEPAEEPAVAQPASPSANGGLSATQEAVAGVWREMLGVDGLTPDDDFFDLGGSSLMAIQLGTRLRQVLGAELPASFLLEASTLGALADLVERASAGAVESSCLVRLQRGPRRPLFLVHQVGGHAFTFRALARGLGRDQPVYALRSLGLEEGEEPLETIAEMAEHYLGLVREAQPRGPYLLGGASMGGMVAYEMAQQLEARGEQVALLTLMDTPCQDQMPEREGHAEAVAAALPVELPVPLDRLRAVAPDEQLDFVIARARRAGTLPEGFDASTVRRHVAVILANVAALYGYVPRPYPGRMLYFRASCRRPADPPRPELPWIELVGGGVEVVRVAGDHMTMHEEPNLKAMAAHLEWALDLCRQPRWLEKAPRRATADRAERAEPAVPVAAD